MKEIELKLLLDPAQERALRRSPDARAMGEGRPRTEILHSIYYDTPDGALRSQRMSLRLRRAGRKWVQTIKQAHGSMINGLSMPQEFEMPVRGQTLALERIRDDDLRETLIGYAQQGLAPVVETRFRRTRRVLRLPNGARVEMAIDVGDLAAGDQTAPLAEAEFELLEGRPADLYAVAAAVFTHAPVRFATNSKSARAAALLEPAAPPALRKAKKLALTPDQTAEDAAIAILEEGLSHFLPNLADLLCTDAPSGPHQTRVALRRMRSALKAFRPVLGARALDPWADQARQIASVAGRLRDLDVLTDDLIPKWMSGGERGSARLREAFRKQRERVRAEVRAVLSGEDVTRFGFDFAGFLAGREWLDSTDSDQRARLSQPLGPFARRVLRKRWKAARAYGVRMVDLNIEERHEMRKEIKKFRYLLDAFRGLYDPEAQKAMMRQLKHLQAAFGALNDHAMAEMILTGPGTQIAGDPLAQKAAARMIGRLEAEADRLWPDAIAGWEQLKSTKRPW